MTEQSANFTVTVNDASETIRVPEEPQATAEETTTKPKKGVTNAPVIP